MRVLGLIAEYNPFHRGHAYQLERARRDLVPDCLLVLMSGNVVQRGQFASVDKWQRAQLALDSGADLVVELPLLASLQAADYFAQWSVDFLSRLCCTDLVFGTESATLAQLEQTLADEATDQAALDQATQALLKAGHSYAYASGQARLHFDHTLTTKERSMPNHILGLGYLRANQSLARPLQAHVIPRVKGADYLSGSQIRQGWEQEEDLSPYLEPKMAAWTQAHPLVTWADYFPFLKYCLLTQSADQLRTYLHVREGIEYLLLKEIRQANCWEDFLNALTSKRWTQASIQRLLLSLLLGIRLEEWELYRQEMHQRPTLRLLAMSPAGQAHVASLRGREDLHLISSLTQADLEVYDLQCRADRVYQLNPRQTIREQNRGKYPIRLKK